MEAQGNPIRLLPGIPTARIERRAGCQMERYQIDKSELNVLESTCVPMAVYQFVNGRVVTLALSQGFLDLFGYPEREFAYQLMDNDMYRDAHPDDVARIAQEANLFAKNEKPYNVVYRHRLSDGYHIVHAFGRHEKRAGDTQIAVIWYVDEGLYRPESGWSESGLMLTREYTHDLQNESGARRSTFDFLTGLANMTYFFELVAEVAATWASFWKTPAVLFLDTSGMNGFNQKYGFAEGDRLIRAVGELLSAWFGADCCSRFRQDHFAVLADSDGLVPRLKALFEEAKLINGGKTLPLRVGIYLDNRPGVSASTACDRAKMACNQTRKAYYSHYRYFNESMLENANKRLYVVDNFEKAVREGWIRVYYQPIIRTANGKVCSEEALARWCDPVQGMISPAEFIPVLEDVKLITQLDLYVLDRVLEKMKKTAGSKLYSVPQSINLSRVDFETSDIVSEIVTRVDASGVERSKLIIEITESVVGTNFDYIKTQIARFRDLGFTVWMDDFGSGYSSLDVLQSVPFDLIKLDMRFMQQFGQGEKNRIILTELVKMASGLGMETVAEGVETEEQLEFLKEIGCTKLQGYYFCKPVPESEIPGRYGESAGLGFENPEESGYYNAIGRINLYDLSELSDDDTDDLRKYFDTFPMAILESGKEGMFIVRCNRAYRLFMQRFFQEHTVRTKNGFRLLPTPKYSVFLRSLQQCCEDGNRAMVEDRTENGAVQTLLQRIAVNPVTGTAACRAVILKTGDDRNGDPTYAYIAQSLSADYFDLFYVEMETEDYIEYGSQKNHRGLLEERRGTGFFAASREEALKRVHPDDQELFIRSFTKEQVLHSLRTQGTFTLTYRLMIDGNPLYVSMKAVRMDDDSRHLIIGINNVDTQIRHQEALERIQKERTTYSRIMAIAGNYLCIYSVDPVTGSFTEYSAAGDYDVLGFPKSGDDIFRQAQTMPLNTVHPDDREMFRTMFQKEKVTREIETSGWFSFNFRLIPDGKPTFASIRAALVEEKGGPVLIIGVVNIDLQVRRDQEYAHNLAAARSFANIDPLTGVKNKSAYEKAEESLGEANEQLKTATEEKEILEQQLEDFYAASASNDEE